MSCYRPYTLWLSLCINILSYSSDESAVGGKAFIDYNAAFASQATGSCPFQYGLDCGSEFYDKTASKQRALAVTALSVPMLGQSVVVPAGTKDSRSLSPMSDDSWPLPSQAASSDRGNSPEMVESFSPPALPTVVKEVKSPCVVRKVHFSPDTKEPTSGRPQKKAKPLPQLTDQAPTVRVGYPIPEHVVIDTKLQQEQSTKAAFVKESLSDKKMALHRRMRNRFELLVDIVDKDERIVPISKMNRDQLLHRQAQLKKIIEIEREYASKVVNTESREALRLLEEVQQLLNS